ncbi:hypothetical protein BH11VER1_BH11VER1_28040 [soil metagenome]
MIAAQIIEVDRLATQDWRPLQKEIKSFTGTPQFVEAKGLVNESTGFTGHLGTKMLRQFQSLSPTLFAHETEHKYFNDIRASEQFCRQGLQFLPDLPEHPQLKVSMSCHDDSFILIHDAIFY